MTDLASHFDQLHGQETKQIGKYFCIPAAVSNALRVLGADDFTQERIRDEWYRHQGRTPEPNLDDQMRDAGPGVVGALRSQTDFNSRFTTASFERPLENSVFNAAKADEAIQFITDHVTQSHPVMVSTDHLVIQNGLIQRICCHMWLVLALDDVAKQITAHDSGNDDLFEIPISTPKQHTHIGQKVDIDLGLRGRVTNSNYYCLAFWKC
jgi:hypothetical protein